MPKNSNQYIQEKGFAHALVLVGIIALAGLIALTNTATQQFPGSQNVLGENEEAKKAEEAAKESAKKVEEQSKEAEKKAEEQQKEAAKSSNSGSSESPKTKTETISPTGVKSKTQTEGKKSETEIETLDGQKIKTKVEDDGTTKVEIEHGQLKLKYVVENGQLRLQAENEQGEEVELEDDELDELENELEDKLAEDDIKIATSSGKPVLAKNGVAALTDFPLSIDVGTNQLIVTTPAGQKVVTVLPDQAVQNLLATNIINKVEQSVDPSLTQELGSLSGVVKLEIRNNEVVYKVKGIKTHKVLGFIPVDISTTVFVSTQTGDMVAQEQSLFANVIDLLSP